MLRSLQYRNIHVAPGWQDKSCGTVRKVGEIIATAW